MRRACSAHARALWPSPTDSAISARNKYASGWKGRTRRAPRVLSQAWLGFVRACRLRAWPRCPTRAQAGRTRGAPLGDLSGLDEDATLAERDGCLAPTQAWSARIRP